MVANSRGRHRVRPGRELSGVAGSTGIALVAVALMGTTPVTANSVTQSANSAVYYLKGTEIGDTTSHPAPLVFTTAMMTGVGWTPPQAGDFHVVDYPATIGPFSNGGFRDPSWGVSVARGIAALGEQPQPGDTVFGYSQGAVVATAYKRDHLGNGVNYVLVENPGRPNGGIFERFDGLYIPLLNVRFDGATPVVDDPQEGAGTTVDIARQYDGWADFPTYPLNLLATANAMLGIVYLHGDTQDLDASALADIDTSDPRFYQQHGDTTYYVVPTKRLPLLMPLRGVLPGAVLDRLDAPLRAVVETGYDRSDYSRNTPAQLLPPVGVPAAAAADLSALGANTAQSAPAAPTGTADAGKAPVAAPAATTKRPRPARVSLPAPLRRSAAAISSALRSGRLMHGTAVSTSRTPGGDKTASTAPDADATPPQPNTPDAGHPATKTADNDAHQADAA